MKKSISLLLLIMVSLIDCAGTHKVHITSNYQADRTGKYIVFPFRNPSYKEQEFTGVGARFTRTFVGSCAEYGLNIIPIFDEKYQPSKDINVIDAIAYSKENGFDYIITGQITKWIDRATEWSGKRDFAGLEIFVRKVDSGNIIFSAELQKHSNIFWSGTPDDFVNSLSKKMAKKFIAPKRKRR